MLLDFHRESFRPLTGPHFRVGGIYMGDKLIAKIPSPSFTMTTECYPLPWEECRLENGWTRLVLGSSYSHYLDWGHVCSLTVSRTVKEWSRSFRGQPGHKWAVYNLQWTPSQRTFELAWLAQANRFINTGHVSYTEVFIGLVLRISYLAPAYAHFKLQLELRLFWLSCGGAQCLHAGLSSPCRQMIHGP